jgi:UDP-N-acetylmuramoyl-tripeptide--D-alanyl-D-alanine ligase
MDWETIIAGLASTHSDLRMRPFTRTDGTIILDDTYNASPASTVAALELLGSLPGRRVAILGDMLELGQYESAGHHKVGLAAANAADALVLIGERSKIIADAAMEAGFANEHIHWFPDSSQAADHIAALVKAGDTTLVKGSNLMRMDRILKTLKEGE